MTEKDIERLDWLEKQIGAMSAAEVIRRALSVYQQIVQLQVDETKFIVRDKAGNETVLFFG